MSGLTTAYYLSRAYPKNGVLVLGQNEDSVTSKYEILPINYIENTQIFNKPEFGEIFSSFSNFMTYGKYALFSSFYKN